MYFVERQVPSDHLSLNVLQEALDRQVIVAKEALQERQRSSGTHRWPFKRLKGAGGAEVKGGKMGENPWKNMKNGFLWGVYWWFLRCFGGFLSSKMGCSCGLRWVNHWKNSGTRHDCGLRLCFTWFKQQNMGTWYKQQDSGDCKHHRLCISPTKRAIIDGEVVLADLPFGTQISDAELMFFQRGWLKPPTRWKKTSSNHFLERMDG